MKSVNDFHFNLPSEVAKKTENSEKRITRNMSEKNELMESYSENEDLQKIYDDIEKNQVTFLT